MGPALPRDRRRLAAIVSADVVAYSRHMAENESATMAALRTARQELIDPMLLAHGGRIFKAMGDGLLVEFSSVVAAVECAAAIQRGMRQRPAPTGASPRLQLRIGINLGDVIVEADESGAEDVFGDGVNIAARVQEVAEPDGIALSGTVVDHVRNKVGFGFLPLGERRLKNIDDPIPIYALGPQQHASGSERAERVLVRPAVAILPFRNLSGDPAQEYFADGITEELITALSSWRWFPVIARNSTFTFKGRAVDVAEVGKALGARYVVEGSVQRAGDHVRISAQLLDADTRVNLWAHSYQRHLGDVFELQDEISRAVVGAIEPHLTRAEQQRAARKRPENLDSWDLSLQALAHIRAATSSSLASATTLLDRAFALDPHSSRAQSLLALTRFQGALAGWTADPGGSLASTYEAADVAVTLDQGDWLAHALLGIATLWSRRDYERAAAEEETAVALNPSAAIAYHFFGCVLTFDSRPAAAIPKLDAVLKLDPHFPFHSATLADLGLAYLLIGECDTALRYCERAIAERAENVRAWQRLTSALAHLDRVEEAAQALAQVRRLQKDFSPEYVQATYPFRDPVHSALFTDGLRKAGWQG